MSRGTIYIGQTGEPIVIDFDVQKPEDSITVEITPTDVKIHTPNEPKVSVE